MLRTLLQACNYGFGIYPGNPSAYVYDKLVEDLGLRSFCRTLKLSRSCRTVEPYCNPVNRSTPCLVYILYDVHCRTPLCGVHYWRIKRHSTGNHRYKKNKSFCKSYKSWAGKFLKLKRCYISQRTFDNVVWKEFFIISKVRKSGSAIDLFQKKLKCLWFIGSTDVDTFKVPMSAIATLSSVYDHLWWL